MDISVISNLFSVVIYLLLIVGPPLGCWYFIFTAREVMFYKKMAQWKTFR
jgi:hypothetical protein